jgi:dsRNA-specific ribonuclease
MSSVQVAPVAPLILGQHQKPYEALARQRDFQLCIKDVIIRSGVTDDKIIDMLGDPKNPNMEVYHEFAKCFVPEAIDPENNYELYELYGDLTLNKATISYIFRILHPLLSQKASPRAIAYLDAIKAKYVSKKFYPVLTKQLGFDEFVHRVCFSSRQVSEAYVRAKIKNAQDLYEDVIEAFIGCLEIQFDRYVGMHQGYAFVANFVYDLLAEVKIDFDPRKYWDNHRLLKETNDKITSYNTRNPQDPLLFFSMKRNGFRYQAGVSKDTKGQDSFIPIGSPVEACSQNEAENMVGDKVLEYMDSEKKYKTVRQHAPTAAELGIEHLVE